MKYCKYILLWAFFAFSLLSHAYSPSTTSLPATMELDCLDDEDHCIKCVNHMNLQCCHFQLQNLLIHAIREQMENCVAHLIAMGVDLNQLPKNSKLSTPLNIATRFNAGNITRLLISAGADPDKPDNSGILPVTEAIHSGYCSIIPLLFAKGGNPNPVLTSPYGKLTPLTESIAWNRFECIRELVRLGVDINRLVTGEREDLNGLTPFMISITGGHTRLAERLVHELNADIEVKNIQGDTALLMAVRMEHTHAVKVLVEELGADISATDEYLLTAVDIAFSRRNRDLVLYLEEAQRNQSSFYLLSVFYNPMHDSTWEEIITYTVSTLALALIPGTLISSCCIKCRK